MRDIEVAEAVPGAVVPAVGRRSGVALEFLRSVIKAAGVGVSGAEAEAIGEAARERRLEGRYSFRTRIGVLAVYATLRRTLGYIVAGTVEEAGFRDSPCRKPLDPREKDNITSETAFYPWFNLIALLSALAVPLLWAYLCTNDRIEIKGAQHSTLVGFFFSYRCLHPASGVSPILPILFLLFSWYLWAFFQTRRLRFSENSRPMLPKHIDLGTPVPLYVSDDALGSCSRSVDSCLYENISCLLITRQVLHRLLPHRGSRINLVLGLIYAILFATFVFGLPVQSLDRFLRSATFHLTPYEFLISALFYPLLVVALTGTLRLLLVWAALSQGLLEPLERSPLRFAFSRLTSTAWITMLRQGGLLEYWRTWRDQVKPSSK